MKIISVTLLLFFLFTSCTNHLFADGNKVIITEKYQHPIIEIHTAKGVMKFELYEDKTPNSVANFILLAEAGFYNKQKFHRISDEFLVQGGCPNTKDGSNGKPGTGNAGYTIDEESHPQLKHDYGMLTMARKNAKGTTSSQFCIFLDKAAHLDGEYTVFGKLIEGKEVLAKLAELAGPRGTPKELVSYDIKVISKNNTNYKIKKNSQTIP